MQFSLDEQINNIRDMACMLVREKYAMELSHDVDGTLRSFDSRDGSIFTPRYCTSQPGESFFDDGSVSLRLVHSLQIITLYPLLPEMYSGEMCPHLYQMMDIHHYND
jgi:hypothetical protein